MSTIITGFIAFVMITSIMGFLYTDTTDIVKIDDYKFERVVGGWQLDTEYGRVPFQFLPTDVDGITIPQEITRGIQNARMVLITMDPEGHDMNGLREIASITFSLSEILNERLSVYNPPPTISREDERVPNSTIVSCENSTSYMPVILFKTGNMTEAKIESTCIVFTGESNRDLARLKDKLMYDLVGVVIDQES